MQKDDYNYCEDPHSSHQKIINLINSNSKVIDVGCNKGYLAKQLKDKGCFVLGLESDFDSAEVARKYCDDILVRDVEVIDDLNYPADSFDAIVFADILEHLKYPERLVLNLSRYLKPEGIIIASLPNIARIDIRLKFLFGKFGYEDSGILDRTHLRFFTFDSAKKLFTDNGFYIQKTDFTAAASRFKIFPRLIAFQFIIVAKKNKT